MFADEALSLLDRMLWNAALVSGPILLAILLVCKLISVFLVATQIQEMTLTDVPKLLVSGLLLVFLGSQPYYTLSLASDVSSLTITNPRLDVEAGKDDATIRMGVATVGDLVQALNGMNVDTRRIISILQALKSAGALHAELIVE